MTPEKRNQLIFLVLVTGLVAAILQLVVVSAMQNSLISASGALEQALLQKSRAEQALAQEGALRKESEEQQARLKEFESSMPSGDTYGWLRKTLRPVTQRMAVELVEVGRPFEPKDNVPVPPAGYMFVRTTIKVTGSYFELGYFLAEFENAFATAQIDDLSVSPFAAPTSKGPAELVLTARLLFLASRSDVYALPRQ